MDGFQAGRTLGTASWLSFNQAAAAWCAGLCHASLQQDVPPHLQLHCSLCCAVWSSLQEGVVTMQMKKSAHDPILHPSIASQCLLCRATLNIEELLALPELRHTIANSMEDMAQLSGLTKLSFMSYEVLNLKPLSQLTSLQELGLCCPDKLDSCDAVLNSSMRSLRYITLAADHLSCFSLATYQALHQMPHLAMLKLEITLCVDISPAEAAGLAGIRAKHFHLQLEKTTLLDFVMFHQQAEIHELTLWDCGDTTSRFFMTQDRLKTLNVVGAKGFTGERLRLQPSVTELHIGGELFLIICGLKNILTNLPALTTLTIPKAAHAEYTRTSEDFLRLQILVYGERQTQDVVYIDLEHLRRQICSFA